MLNFKQFNESLNDVIGTTDGYGPEKSGKNAKKIYSSFDHPSHKDFDYNDHDAAASAHSSKMYDVRRQLFPKQREYLSKVQKEKLEKDPTYIYHKTQKELHEEEANRLAKPHDDKLAQRMIEIEKAEIEKRKEEKKFKKEVWKKIPIEDRNKIEQIVAKLDQLKQYHALDTPNGTTVKEQRYKLKKMIQNIEEPYYKKYRNISNILTNKKLSDVDDKTGLFSND